MGHSNKFPCRGSQMQRILTVRCQAGCITVLSFVILDETYAPVILMAKAKKSQSSNKSEKEKRAVTKDHTSASNLQFSRTVLRPLKLLAFCPIALALASYAISDKLLTPSYHAYHHIYLLNERADTA